MRAAKTMKARKARRFRDGGNVMPGLRAETGLHGLRPLERWIEDACVEQAVRSVEHPDGKEHGGGGNGWKADVHSFCATNHVQRAATVGASRDRRCQRWRSFVGTGLVGFSKGLEQRDWELRGKQIREGNESCWRSLWQSDSVLDYEGFSARSVEFAAQSGRRFVEV